MKSSRLVLSAGSVCSPCEQPVVSDDESAERHRRRELLQIITRRDFGSCSWLFFYFEKLTLILGSYTSSGQIIWVMWMFVSADVRTQSRRVFAGSSQ